MGYKLASFDTLYQDELCVSLKNLSKDRRAHRLTDHLHLFVFPRYLGVTTLLYFRGGVVHRLSLYDSVSHGTDILHQFAPVSSFQYPSQLNATRQKSTNPETHTTQVIGIHSLLYSIHTSTILSRAYSIRPYLFQLKLVNNRSERRSWLHWRITQSWRK